MKRFQFIFLGLLFLLSACDLLKKEPLTSITPQNFYSNASDAESALNAAYDAMQATAYYGQNMNVVGEMPSDNVTSTNGDVSYLENITWTPQSGFPNGIFNQAYVTINRANAVLAHVPDVEMDESRKKEILGEAHFIRGLSYFNLVRLYGGVPLRLEPVNSGDPSTVNIKRASVDSVYAQIIQDLDSAEQMAPDTPSDPAIARGQATSGAAAAIEAKVYLYRRNWQKTIEEARKVLANPLYSLLPNYDNLFPPDNSRESIFEIQYVGNPDYGFVLPDLLMPAPPASYSFPKFNIPTDAFIEGYVDTTNDQRFAYNGSSNVSFLNQPGQGNDAGYFVWKWRSSGNFFNSSDNYTVIRLADVKLIYAEASNELNGPNSKAFEQLNDVRTRAGLPAVGSGNYPTRQALRDQIDRQRRLELAFEGQRWFDLLRYARQELATGNEGLHKVTALDIIKKKRGSRDETYLLFPIPQDEINNNTEIKQNPGY